MVSTRSVKSTKFAEGEKVLCYEPDPAKTKVLYNSKVLGIGQKKDEQGRNVVHFLIHFKGWNSSWDRFVTEEYILKDTEENRKLQKELAEKAHLTAGGNLYRRGRKKRTLSRGGSDSERGGGGVRGGGVETDSDGEAEPKAQSHFSPRLRSFLEFDNLIITKQNKLHTLPASPNAVEILELYMKDFTINQIKLMRHYRGHLRPSAGKNAHITVNDITARANQCREIADGLRVYMDFMTEYALLYPTERPQYKEYTSSPRHYSSPIWSSRLNSHENSNHSLKRKDDDVHDLKDESDKPGKDSDRRKSLRSHSDASNSTANTTSMAVTSTTPAPPPESKGAKNSETAPGKGDLPLQEQVDVASLLGQDVVKGGEQLVLRPLSQKEREHLKRLVNRKVVTESFYRSPCTETSTPPSLIFGATHLARALVKIPTIFQNVENSESDMNFINDYLNGFTKFLEEHPEWFGENIYCDNTYPPLEVKEEDQLEA